MEEKCPICLENIETTNNATLFAGKCGHTAHSQCVGSLMRFGNYTCPVCREPFGEVEAENGKNLQRYQKMLKSGLKPATVRQRMSVDGIPAATIDSFFTGGASLQVIQHDEPEPEAFLDVEKYKKLLKVGLDEQAVRQRMTNDKISNVATDSFFESLYS